MFRVEFLEFKGRNSARNTLTRFKNSSFSYHVFDQSSATVESFYLFSFGFFFHQAFALFLFSWKQIRKKKFPHLPPFFFFVNRLSLAKFESEDWDSRYVEKVQRLRLEVCENDVLFLFRYLDEGKNSEE